MLCHLSLRPRGSMTRILAANTGRRRKAAALDAAIGRRLRVLRNERQMSQAALADAVGITFQQIQKYEKGANRISCSTLIEIAAVLSVPVTDFLPTERRRSVLDELGGNADDDLVGPMLQAFTSVRSKALRRGILGLVRQIVDENAGKSLSRSDQEDAT